MNILQEIIKAQGGQVIGQLANQFNLDSADAVKALSNLVPAIAGGLKKTAQSQSGLESLISKIESSNDVQQAIESPNTLERSQTTQDGNDILGQIFGSKDVSRTVADQTSQSTGLDVSMLKKMLPLVAGLVMSSLNKRSQSSSGDLTDLLGGLAGAATQSKSSSGLGGLLGSLGSLLGSKKRQQPSSGIESMLDFDGDGNIADDVLNLAKKLF